MWLRAPHEIEIFRCTRCVPLTLQNCADIPLFYYLIFKYSNEKSFPILILQFKDKIFNRSFLKSFLFYPTVKIIISVDLLNNINWLTFKKVGNFEKEHRVQRTAECEIRTAPAVGECAHSTKPGDPAVYSYAITQLRKAK